MKITIKGTKNSINRNRDIIFFCFLRCANTKLVYWVLLERWDAAFARKERPSSSSFIPSLAQPTGDTLQLEPPSSCTTRLDKSFLCSRIRFGRHVHGKSIQVMIEGLCLKRLWERGDLEGISFLGKGQRLVLLNSD